MLIFLKYFLKFYIFYKKYLKKKQKHIILKKSYLLIQVPAQVAE